MHSHDPDLVASLAEGTLGKGDARAAEADISTCPRCSADLAAHRSALEASRTLASASLTSDEREGLRAAIAAAINLDLDEAPAGEPRRRRSRRSIPWPQVAVAALSILAVVAVVPLVGTLSTGDADLTADSLEVALSAAEESTTAVAEEAPAAGADDTDFQTRTDEAATEMGSAADGAAAETTIAAAAAPPAPIERIADQDLLAILDAAPELLAAATPLESEPCDDVAAEILGGADDVLRSPVPVGDREAIAYVTSSDGASIDRFVIVDLETCQVIGSSG